MFSYKSRKDKTIWLFPIYIMYLWFIYWRIRLEYLCIFKYMFWSVTVDIKTSWTTFLKTTIALGFSFCPYFRCICVLRRYSSSFNISIILSYDKFLSNHKRFDYLQLMFYNNRLVFFHRTTLRRLLFFLDKS